MQLKLSFYDWCCLVPRPHFSSRRKCFGSRGPCENVYSARSPRIRHQNELTERDWENAVQGLGNDWCISILSSKKMSDANHRSGSLRKRKFTSTGSKGHCLWFVIGGFRSVLRVSVFQGSLHVILLRPKPDVIFQIFLIDFIPRLQTSKFRWGKNTEYSD